MLEEEFFGRRDRGRGGFHRQIRLRTERNEVRSKNDPQIRTGRNAIWRHFGELVIVTLPSRSHRSVVFNPLFHSIKTYNSQHETFSFQEINFHNNSFYIPEEE